MSLTSFAMFGIMLGFVMVVVGFLMGGPRDDSEKAWNKKPAVRKTKKRVRSVPRAA
jgi:hypothetical protein